MRKHLHVTHRGHRPMPLSRWEHVFIYIALPALLITIAAYCISAYAQHVYPEISVMQFLGALAASVLRITAAYAISLVLGVALALLSLSTPTSERILLPIWDVLESLPVLVFFPVIIAVFFALGGYSLAAIVIMALSMIWNIVFSSIGGLRVIPTEVRTLGHVFGLTWRERMRHIILPALFPSLVTGSLLAWAEGWNMLMIAEVVHTYLPNATADSDLFGIGSVLVHASATGNTHAFIAAVGVMVAVVAVMNLFVWQPLLRTSEKYKFE